MYSVRDQPTFTIEHRIAGYGKWGSAERLMAPFDHYAFHAIAFAIDPTTNRSVRVATFAVTDTLGDFVVRSHDAAATSKFAYDSGDGPATMEIESRVLQAKIKRSAIAKAFTSCLFFVNWSLTVGSVYITVLVALGRLRANSMIAGLPFSALLTIPAIRSLYSASPPLGISIGAHPHSRHSIRGLIYAPRCSCLFRTGCDCGIVLSHLVEGLYKTSSPLTASGVFCLSVHYIGGCIKSNSFECVMSVFQRTASNAFDLNTSLHFPLAFDTLLVE